jgi:hypothetical protein
MHNHNHQSCVHELKYCAKCNVAYCVRCGEEWRQEPAINYRLKEWRDYQRLISPDTTPYNPWQIPKVTCSHGA